MSVAAEAAASAGDPFLDLIGAVADEVANEPARNAVVGAPVGMASPRTRITMPPDEEPSDQDDTAAPAVEAAHDAAELPDLSPTVPDELAEYLDDDPLDLDDPDPATADEGDGEEPAYVDEETARLRKENAQLRKRADHAEKLRVENARAGWAKEAEKYFPLAALDDIHATSKRAFLRAARDSHQKIHAHVKPVLDQARSVIADAKAAAVQEGKAEAVGAWGKPLVGPSATTVPEQPRSPRADAAPNLTSWIKAQFDDAKLFG